MATIVEVKVPDIGDFKDIPIIEVFVKAGDKLKAEDPLISLESDKATMDVPSPVDGVVKELKVKLGDKVSEGFLILTVDADAGPAGVAPPQKVKEGGHATAAGAPSADYGTSGVYESIEVRVPDIGDFKDIQIIEVFVKAGDTVKAEDPLISLESDKATMDVPSPVDGVVKGIKVKLGDKVSEGSLILTVDADAAPAGVAPPQKVKEGGHATASGAPSADYGAAGVYESIEVRVPDIGDFKDIPIIEVFVKAGDTVKAEDPLISLESDKATMDVPSPVDGVVKGIKVKLGD